MTNDELELALRDAKLMKLKKRLELRDRVLRCREQNPDMTVTELCRRFGLSLTLVKTFISEAGE